MVYSNSSALPSIPVDRNVLPVPKQLLNLNTTTVNQVLGLPGMFSTFVARDLRNLRILALTASSASIVACTASIFFLLNIDKRKKTFRHDLIFFLIICDMVKALVLMIYPLVILVKNEIYAEPAFYNTLGWFTAYCVEGADMAIFFFAIHFALLIFIPSWKWRHRGSGKMEGGLYCVRAYIWPITALFPVLLASLAFVNFQLLDEEMLIENTTVIWDNDNYHFPYYARLGGYKPYSAWCYLPPYPLWYKLVLSWGPRYFLIIFIFVLYIAIYVFVRKESKRIKSQIFDFKDTKSIAEKEEILAGSKLELFRIKCRRYLLKPMIGVVINVKNFLSFNFEDSSSSSRGRSSMSSSGSFYADLSISADHITNGIDFECDENIGSEHSGSNSFDFMHDRCSDEEYISDARRKQPSIPTMNNSTDNRNQFLDLEDEAPNKTYNVQHGNHQLHNQRQPKYDAPQALVANHSIEGNSAGRNKNLTPERTFLSPIQSLYVPDNRRNAQNDRNLTSPRCEMNSARQGSITDLKDVQANFQKQTYAAMKRRRLQIQKNLRSIFIYPFSYIAIWIFPLIVDITQYHYEIVHGPIVWLIYIATIAQPLNGLVDTLVFVYREKPWNCSWKIIQTKELCETYLLKGGLSEKDIRELYHSDLGRKGWYYCGRFNRKGCWKHKPQRWKRAMWYFCKFVEGVVKNDYSYQDNCEEVAQPHYTCTTEKISRGSNSVKAPCEQRERQFSFPSDSTTSSAQYQNAARTIDDQNYISVSGFWKFVHLLPMLGGIDLDKVNQELRRKSNDHDFILPGLNLALNKEVHDNSRTANENNFVFKPDYSVTKEKPVENARQDAKVPGILISDTSQTSATPAGYTSDIMTETPFGKTGGQGIDENSNEDEMGMLAFLTGPTS